MGGAAELRPEARAEPTEENEGPDGSERSRGEAGEVKDVWMGGAHGPPT